MDKSKLNTHFQNLEVDYLYHLGLDSSMDLKAEFGDVKYVVLTRSFSNADYFTNQFTKAWYGLKDVDINCKTIAKDERYHIYKVGNTLIISHGVGFPSMLICLNEVVKLMWHAGVEDYKFIRFIPGFGLGVAAGSVVVGCETLNPELKPEWKNIEFGEEYTYQTNLDLKMASDLVAASPDHCTRVSFYDYNASQCSVKNPAQEITTIVGKVMSSSGYFSGPYRFNSATVPSYTPQEQKEYLAKATDAGVCGIDLEASCFAAFCEEFKIPGSIVMAVMGDRLQEDEFEPSFVRDDDQLSPALTRAGQVIINYILSNSKRD